MAFGCRGGDCFTTNLSDAPQSQLEFAVLRLDCREMPDYVFSMIELWEEGQVEFVVAVRL